MDVASGIDRHPDRTCYLVLSDCRYRIIESSSLVSALFRVVWQVFLMYFCAHNIITYI